MDVDWPKSLPCPSETLVASPCYACTGLLTTSTGLECKCAIVSTCARYVAVPTSLILLNCLPLLGVDFANEIIAIGRITNAAYIPYRHSGSEPWHDADQVRATLCAKWFKTELCIIRDGSQLRGKEEQTHAHVSAMSPSSLTIIQIERKATTSDCSDCNSRSNIITLTSLLS